MKYLSLDVGGSKTSAVLYDENGIALNKIITKSAHVLQNDREVVIERLKETLQIVDDINTVIVLGYAGYGKDVSVRRKIEDVCNEAFNEYKFYIVSDAMLGLKSSLNGQDGIMVIVGTGSIGLAIKDNEQFRCGGFGFKLEDEGSGYWIAHESLKVFCKMIDGRLEKTILYDEVIKFFNLENEYDIIGVIHNKDIDVRGLVSSFCKVVFELSKKGEINCQRIIEEASIHVSLLINTLASRFEKPVLATGIGSVIEHGEGFFNLVKNRLNNRITWIKPIKEIEYGGYLIGKNKDTN